MSDVRLTPAQRRGLVLLATPGAEAHITRDIRWRVLVDGAEIGTVHSESLGHLREHGLVDWCKGPTAYDHRQRINDRGREVVRGWQ